MRGDQDTTLSCPSGIADFPSLKIDPKDNVHVMLIKKSNPQTKDIIRLDFLINADGTVAVIVKGSTPGGGLGAGPSGTLPSYPKPIPRPISPIFSKPFLIS